MNESNHRCFDNVEKHVCVLLLASSRMHRNAGDACQLFVDACDALHLAFGGEALIESFGAELPHLLVPRTEAIAPAFDTTVFRLRILRGQISADADM